ncbi:uncharacterized protein B0I36DRAFT_69255 [Microdochium trichocladiopsis]|uniref:Uncharacterized protein n=1 Tax=Microdochium trichocladiopsis TaxID=1682393 RepID=A0A9P9BS85_9PEZI|nr:uncharacterized protein B0I36DRAFT_69255 [Microdochium trichocladiopsis]KAH7037645.1 hypothetical protein B0I36DRAFT_69255 [Microdochium trichocladiopsis]
MSQYPCAVWMNFWLGSMTRENRRSNDMKPAKQSETWAPNGWYIVSACNVEQDTVRQRRARATHPQEKHDHIHVAAMARGKEVVRRFFVRDAMPIFCPFFRFGKGNWLPYCVVGSEFPRTQRCRKIHGKPVQMQKHPFPLKALATVFFARQRRQ